jgi:uncharacterized protein YecE (DUF72 family)
VHVGCSGWNYDSWRERLYPKDLAASHWLDHYSRCFQTVEVNATFYRLIRREAVARWTEQTPDGFLFAVKASRYLTHLKRLAGIADGVKRFYERVQPLAQAGRLAVVLWQLPETFHRDERRLADALERLPAGRHAFEFRHPSWFAPEVYDVLERHDAALVIGDHPERPFQTERATARWGYVRLHYGRRGRRGNYSERELREWAGRLRRWGERQELFVYFNNDWEAFAPRNALRLMRLLDADPTIERLRGLPVWRMIEPRPSGNNKTRR